MAYEHILFANNEWAIFIKCALVLTEKEIPEEYKIHICAKLAHAYFELGDDSNVIKFSEISLESLKYIGEKNSQYLLHILGQSYLLKGLPDKACEKFKQYNHIKRSFSLYIEEAELLLQSSLENKLKDALTLIVSAFEESESFDDNLFISAFMILLELSNAKVIPIEGEKILVDNLFVKLDGFSNGWFYIGSDGKSLGAERLLHGSSNYNAVIGKKVSEEIEWPANKFSGSKVKPKVVHIIATPAYLCQRAHEAMENISKLGNAPIWSINVINEEDRKSTRLNSSHTDISRMPSSA